MPGRGLILGIETSCDETAAAIVQRGEHTLSSVVASQIATHARYGGVVPELASREHLRAIVPVVRAALAEAHLALADLDAIAVTSGPGLAGALLVGITYAKALAFAQSLPLIAVNHLEGHIHAVLLHERETASHSSTPSNGKRSPDAQSLALVASGGHTHLYLAQPAHGSWTYSLVGRTVDDAAGEAYDKVAKLLGLGYPGGPWVDALARYGDPHAVPFSFAQIKPKAHLAGKTARTKAARTAPIARLDPRFMFSFSGIKTAVLRYVELHDMRGEARPALPACSPQSLLGARPQGPDSETRETTNPHQPTPGAPPSAPSVLEGREGIKPESFSTSPPANPRASSRPLPTAHPRPHRQLSACGGRRFDQENLRRRRIAGRPAHPRHRRRGRQPRASRPLCR